MNPVNFEGANRRLLPPPSDPNVDPLMVFDRDGQMISVWRPTTEQLKALQEGAFVLLHVWGARHPPVLLSVQRMTEHHGGVHFLVDSSQTRCGRAIAGLGYNELWTQTKERVTCDRCKDATTGT